MGRIHSQSKKLEKWLIRKFVCDALGYTISHSEWTERPDSILTLQVGKIKKRVAIEHTGYYNDTVAGKCSPLTPISDFWKRVQTSLGRRISHRKHLADVRGVVTLNKKQFPKQSKAKKQELAGQFAKELIAFLENHSIPKSKFGRYSLSSSGRYANTFSGFPMLQSRVVAINIGRFSAQASTPYDNWQCSNLVSGCIGLSLEYIRIAIRKKNKKAADYDWQSADEKWLLIVATGNTPSEHAGPPEEWKWDDAELRKLCCFSPFDRIFFCEYPKRWYKLLKPSYPIVYIPQT